MYLSGLVLSLDLDPLGGVDAEDDSAVDDFLLGLADELDPDVGLAADGPGGGPATAGTGSGRFGGLTPGKASG